ncbi:14444_t:CDS:2 [Cetraspora pellucida]|uniref:14444_t:CDS:1 n=1 Tax=Cetraspora pellucida TaxID=1433469 RepID=A0A9N8WEE8_9GLOM|nr:14444_t:CDS:2 [Cetraspora pellucida]
MGALKHLPRCDQLVNEIVHKQFVEAWGTFVFFGKARALS